MIKAQAQFIVLNGLINGYSAEDIIRRTGISEELFVNIVGFKSLDEYKTCIEDTSSHLNLTEVEDIVLKYFKMTDYCVSTFAGSENQKAIYNTLSMLDVMKDKRTATNGMLKNFILPMFPEIVHGEHNCIHDGVFEIAKTSNKAVEQALIKVIRLIAYGYTTPELMSKIITAADLRLYTKELLSADIKKVISDFARNGYNLGVVKQLSIYSMTDAVTSFETFNAVLQFIPAINKTLMLTTVDKTSDMIIVVLTDYIIPLLATNKKLLDSAVYVGGTLFLLSNSGSYNITLPQEAVYLMDEITRK